MSSAAYLYSLTDNDGVVRRDLPVSLPVPNLASPNDTFELNALEVRARARARNFHFLDVVQPPRPEDPRLVPSADGKIKNLLLTIPIGNTSGDFGAIYNKLFESLPATTTLTCLVNTGSKAAVEGWAQAHGRSDVTLIEAPDHVGFSIWAQDAYAVSQSSSNETYFIEPLSFLRYADAVISDYVSTATPLRNFQTPLYFQGGNILVGDDFWFVGIDYPTNTLGYVENAIFPDAGESPEALVRRLFSEYLDSDRQLSYIGSTLPVPSEAVVLVEENGTHYVDVVFQGNQQGTAQPLFHIDMFLTLAGRNADGQYQILVGDPSLAPNPPATSFAGYTMQNIYDNIDTNLKNAGFETIRNPLPLTFDPQTIPVAALNRPDDSNLYAIYLQLTNAGLTEVTLRSWYFATANNALVQNDAADRRVWLPTYGHGSYSYLQASDQANKELWEDLGYTVVMLPSFHRLARGLGAVHCIQKYLDRS